MSKKKKPELPPSAGYSDAAKNAVQETAQRVEEMHRAIASKSFDVLNKIPVVSGPAQLVQGAHDAITASVYAAIRHGAGGLLGAASMLEKHSTDFTEEKPPGRLASGLRGALNGAFGDHLAASGNLLAINMALHVDGAPLALDRESLRAAYPHAGQRLCLFIHGLGCDEHSWFPGEKATASERDFGRDLQRELGYVPLYLRYNTGRPIVDNGARLAAFIEELLAVWPKPIGELVIIGHSMGGLISLAACQSAVAEKMSWPARTCMLICLGSPHLGSAVEQLGHLANMALNLTEITAPLGKIAAARSQGIKDLRHGPGAPRNAGVEHGMAFRFLAGSLSEDLDHPFSEFFGDGLVTPGSATTHEIEGDVQSARIGNISHMGLLSDPRVYEQIKEWLAA